jgi:site-specific DNA-methyltransferase (adenine-specific)
MARTANVSPELQRLLEPITSVKPYRRNPRRGNVDAIAESLRENGQYKPVLVRDETDEVLVGNHTLQAAIAEGWTHIAVQRRKGLTDEQAAKIVLVDNRTSDLASYDAGDLAEVLGMVAPDLEGTGYSTGDLDKLLADLTTKPKNAEPWAKPKRAKTRLGDVITMGRHRLMCGDSTDPVQVEVLMATARAQLVYTDPPYGVDYTGGQQPGQKSRAALTGDQAGTDIYTAMMPALLASIDDRAPLYIWFAGSLGRQAYTALDDTKFEVRALIVWHKLVAHYGSFMAQYMPKHEPLLYCTRPKARWHGPKNEVTVWEYDQPARNEHHPTQKPVEIAERAMTNSSEAGDIVLDLFAGSGSTVVAAQNTGRRAYMMELDPGYCDVIVQRWEDVTQEKAIRPTRKRATPRKKAGPK